MSNKNIDLISGLFLGVFLVLLLFPLYLGLKTDTIYLKYNNYNKIDILFIVFFSICLFSFTYICVNFITGQYKTIDNLVEEEQDNNKVLKITFNDDNQNFIFYTILIIFFIIMLVSNMNHMVNNQFEFLNNKYKATLNIFSVIISIIIIGLYFGL
jgi:hypothetical protein